MTIVAARPQRATDVVRLALTRDGRLPKRDVIDRLRLAVGAATDCFVFCPGWLGDEAEAFHASSRFFGLLDAVLVPLRDRIRLARIAVHWPSKPFGDSTATPGAADETLWPDMDRRVTTAHGWTSVRDLFLDVARAEIPASPEEESELDLLTSWLTSGPARYTGPSWPFRALAFWMMKRRASIVGERLGRECFAPLWQALPNAPRLHLIGHSFGATLLTSAVVGGARPESLTLLLGALSAFAFAREVPSFGRPGRYHSVVSERQVHRPVVVLRSDHDRGLASFYRATPSTADVACDRAPGSALRRTAAAVATSGLSTLGARAVGAPVVDLCEAQCTGIPSYPIVNVDGSGVLHAGAPLLGAHHDVFHPEVATLVAMAAGLIVGGPAGARPVPRDPLFQP